MTVIDEVWETKSLVRPQEVGSQRHGRRFKVWRWEHAVAQCEGTEWSGLALRDR